MLAGPNGGFVLATPVGLLLASGFAAASSIEVDDRTEAALRRWQTPMRVGLGGAPGLGGRIDRRGAPLSQVIESERAPWLLALLPLGVAAYAFAAWRYVGIFRRRGQPLPLAVAVAFVLLAEALVAMAFGRAWRASWWEWHVLMAVAFATVWMAVRREYRLGRSTAGTFGGIYLDRTLERLDRRQSAAMTDLVRAEATSTTTETTRAPGAGVHRSRDLGDDRRP